MSGASDSRTRVVLIVDLVGSTTYRVEHGDSIADNMLMQFERRFEEVVVDFDGRIVSNHGDGFLSSFSSATAALAGAVAFRSVLGGLPIDTGVPELRIGIAAGDVIERGREMYGLPVVVAARLETQAEPGEILCADVVRVIAGSRSPVDFASSRVLNLKGLPEDVRAWTVVASDTPERSLLIAAAANKAFPVAPTKFFGRDREMTEVAELLRSRSVTTLLGPGGVGKTRLSVELANANADRFADGVWFVPLESATVTEEVVATIGRAMRLPSSALDGSAEELARALAGVDALLVFDNCEQAVGPIGEVLNTLLSGDSRLVILCSSRESLHVPAEVVWKLDPLTFPDEDEPTETLADNDAVALFVDRGRAVDASRTFSDTQLRNVAEVVRRLEGLPLAIELAASRLNVVSPAEMAARTAGLFELLSEKQGYRPDRHSAIEATVEWSVALLEDVERYVLLGAAVFVGGFRLDAIEDVCPSSTQPILDVLGSLVNKSLLRKTDDRFTMLGSIRETLLLREADQPRIREAEFAMLAFYEDLVRQSDTLVQPGPEWLARFIEDDMNFARSLEIALENDATLAMQLSGQLALSWVLSGQSRTGDRLFTRVLDGAENVDPLVQANAVRGAAMAAGLGGRYDTSAELLENARATYTDLDGDHDVAVGYCDYWFARNTIVQCHFGLVEPTALEEAYGNLESAMTAFRNGNDLLGELLAFPYLGWSRLLQGQNEAARAHTEAMLTLANSLGETLVKYYALAHSAFIGLSLGDLEQAEIDIERALKGLVNTGDIQNLVITECVNTALQARLHGTEPAITAVKRLLAYARQCDSSEWEGLVVSLAAHVLASSGDWACAAQLLTHLEQVHPTWRVGMRNTGLDPADVLEHVSDPTEAAATLTYPGAIRLAAIALSGASGGQ